MAGFVLLWNKIETTSATSCEQVQHTETVSPKISMLALPWNFSFLFPFYRCYFVLIQPDIWIKVKYVV